MSYTKGEWKVSDYPEPHGGPQVYADPEDPELSEITIADVWAVGEAMDEETLANARLIAAAPILLAACKSVAFHMQVMMGLANSPPLLKELFPVLADAIAQAEGQN